MLSRRSLLLGSLAAVAGVATLTAPNQALASLARALTLNELVHQSQHALVGTSVDVFGQWESVGARSRIVTYHAVSADYSVDGRPPATGEITVRTLGGRVGDIGQVVPGEALLQRGRAATLFLSEISRNVFAVTGMAQGHYPVVADERGVRRLQVTAGALELLGGAPAEEAAVHRLSGRTVSEVEALVYGEMARGAR